MNADTMQNTEKGKIVQITWLAYKDHGHKYTNSSHNKKQELEGSDIN